MFKFLCFISYVILKDNASLYIGMGLITQVSIKVILFTAYTLANEGYDVWLGNFRGNIYSKRHESLHPKEFDFWDWS